MELLVVIGILAALLGILLPAVSAAREAGRTALCGSNIRQLVIASGAYANDNEGYWPPAHYYFYTQNLHRWHGARPSTATPFDFSGSPLRKYLLIGAIKSCPSFDVPDGAAGFERSAGGYGYNSEYLGSSIAVPGLGTLSLPIADYEARVVNVPAKITQIVRPVEKIAFTDAAIANPGLIEYSFAEPPILSGMPSSPSIHFRHRRRANVAWADGHVTTQAFEWTYPTNVYGADNQKNMLGFFGPRDNSLFQRN